MGKMKQNQEIYSNHVLDEKKISVKGSKGESSHTSALCFVK